jgi:hypothetical protein
MFPFIYCLVNYGVVLLLGVVAIVDGWVDCWCSDVSLVWRKPNRNAAAFLLNLSNDQFMHRCLQVLHHQTTGVLYHNLRCPEPLHWFPEVLLCPELLHHLVDGWHHMTTYTAYPTTPRLLGITLFSANYCTDFLKYYSVSVPSCYTEAPADVSIKTVEYYTEATKYYSAPIYTTTTEAAKYYAVPTCYTKAALSCCVEQILHWCSSLLHHDLRYT